MTSIVRFRCVSRSPMTSDSSPAKSRSRTPASLSNRCLRNLHRLWGLVSPRASSAVFSVIWSRWCTCRRFQKRHTDSNVYYLARSPSARDSSEHHMYCPRVREVGERLLRLHPAWTYCRRKPYIDPVWMRGTKGWSITCFPRITWF